MKMAEFVESHQGSEALHFEGYAYSKVRDGKGLGLSFTLIWLKDVWVDLEKIWVDLGKIDLVRVDFEKVDLERLNQFIVHLLDS